MKSAIKKIYNSVCARIYSVGRLEAQRRRNLYRLESVVVGEGTVLHQSCTVANLSGVKDNISLGNHCHLFGHLAVYNYAGQITMGNYSTLGEFSRIVSGLRISIGSRVLIAHNVNILDNNSHPIDAKLRHDDFRANFESEMKEYDLKSQEIVIEDDVWIGFNSIILKGVRIGRGAIIGAGSVVVKDVEPWTINVGNPLRCIQKIEPVVF
jgi:acetyltransferase-like isoleucine patch superfamily enzyme